MAEKKKKKEALSDEQLTKKYGDKELKEGFSEVLKKVVVKPKKEK